jgi:hypothetical protein
MAGTTAPSDGPLLASGVASELPWWMWFLPVIAVALPAAFYWWRHRPTPPDAAGPEVPGGSEVPGKTADSLPLDLDSPDLHVVC